MSDEHATNGSPYGAVRAGILITGTEVLTGIISDRNGPWLSERLREMGVDAALIAIVGDRPRTSRRRPMRSGLQLVIASGGPGPTADDLTAEIIGGFCGREMVLDAAAGGANRRVLARGQALPQSGPRGDPSVEPQAGRDPRGRNRDRSGGDRPRASTCHPRTMLPMVRPWSSCPARRGSCEPMWRTATGTEVFRSTRSPAPPSSGGRSSVLYGIPESEIANTLRAAEEAGLRLSGLEITTCLRRAEIEVSTRFEPDASDDYEALISFIAIRHGDAPVLAGWQTRSMIRSWSCSDPEWWLSVSHARAV